MFIFLFIVAYEIPYSVITKFPNAHPYKLLSYVFSMRVSIISSLIFNGLCLSVDLAYSS